MEILLLHENAGRREAELREVDARLALVEMFHRGVTYAEMRYRQKRAKSFIRRRRKHDAVEDSLPQPTTSSSLGSPGDSKKLEAARMRNKLEAEQRMNDERARHARLMNMAQLRFAMSQREREMAVEQECEELLFQRGLLRRSSPPAPRLLLERSFNTPSPTRRLTKSPLHRRLPPIAKTPEPVTPHSLILNLKRRANPDVTADQLRVMMKKHVAASTVAENRRCVLERLEKSRLVMKLRETESSIEEKALLLKSRLQEATEMARSPLPTLGTQDRPLGKTAASTVGSTAVCTLLDSTAFQENVRTSVWCTNREIDRYHESSLLSDLAEMQASRASGAVKACSYYEQRVVEGEKSRDDFLARCASVCDSLAALSSGAAARAFRVKSTDSKKPAVDRRVLVAALKKLARTPVISRVIKSLEEKCSSEIDLRDAGTISFDDLLCIRSVLNASNYISGLQLRESQVEEETVWRVLATIPKDYSCVTKVIVVCHDQDNAAPAESSRDDAREASVDNHSLNIYADFAANMARRNREVALFEHGLRVSRRQVADLSHLEKMDVVHLAHTRRRLMMTFQCLALSIAAHEALLRELCEISEHQMRLALDTQLRQTLLVALAGGKEWRTRRLKLCEEECLERRALETLMMRNVSLLEKELSAGLSALKRSTSARSFQKTANVASIVGKAAWLHRPAVQAKVVVAAVAVPASISAEAELLLAAASIPVAADSAVFSSSGDIRAVHSSSGKRPSSRLGPGSGPIVHMQLEPMND